MKRIAAGLLLLLSCGLVWAGLPPLDAQAAEALLPTATRANLGAAVSTGSFVQKKQLKDLPQPLVSRGRYLIARGVGIDWQVQKPFASRFVLTATALTEKNGSGTRRSAAAQQPGFAAASRLLLALFALDLETLDREFRFAGAREGARWTLQLTPRNAALATAFAEARLEGTQQLDSVRLLDGQGDVTELLFSGQATQPALTPEQKAGFE